MNTTLRRPEFDVREEAVLHSVLQGASFGHVAYVNEDGGPEVRAMNFIILNETLYFHGAEGGQVGRWGSMTVTFAAEDRLCWLPSYWRHPDMACPATTYYRSVLVRGQLRAVVLLEEKAAVLEAFMQKYQEEGGYRTIDAGDVRYQGPLRALSVLALPLQQWTCKVKAGQHLTDTVRATVQDRLVQRGYNEDLACARQMQRANPGLAGRLPYPCVDADGLHWSDAAEDVEVRAAWDLLKTTYWANTRNQAMVRRQLKDASLSMSAHRGDQLVAMARVVRVSRKVNWLFDVVIVEGERRSGLGSRMLSRILAHPALADITRLLLDTRDAMPFYHRFGFRDLERNPDLGSTLMVWTR